MNIRFVTPRAELRPYVESFWVLESPVGLPAAADSIAAPNGCAKLIIPYDNSIVAEAEGRVQVTRAHHMHFVGNRDVATRLHTSPQRTGFIAIEFRPHGAFPLFGVPMSDTANGLWDADEVFGAWSRTAQDLVNNEARVAAKISLIEHQLVLLLNRHRRPPGVVDYCVATLRSTDGRMSIRDLERQTGYSRRYLARLFQQHVGLSPKRLAEIFRFQRFYRMWAAGASFDLVKTELYDHYYDQSHFTREFKRMTGYPPERYVHAVANDFGRRLASRSR
jgi:AraC-like DNA-binding protein